MAGKSGGRSSSQPTDLRRLGKQRQRCQALTKRGMQCRHWAQYDSDFCHMHQDGDATVESKSWQTSIPSSLPGVTEAQLHQNEKEIQRQIERRKAATEREKVRKEKSHLAKAKSGATKIAKQAGLVTETKLRTLEDCLMLIEYAVDEILDMPPSINKSKTFIQAARTAGQLIIQAGVADQAVEWFKENVKLVAGVDLEQI